MFCEKCGAETREGAKFCPECGVAAGGGLPQAAAAEYRYETTQALFPFWKGVVPLLIIWLVFSGIGVLAALGSGFWYVGVIISGIVLFSILVVMWGHKGKKNKWGRERTLWVFTPEGFGCGPPPDVARRLGAIGAASAVATAAGRQNWAVTSQGINMAENLKYVNGLEIYPWAGFYKAEYRPGERKIGMYFSPGQAMMLAMTIEANKDNYAQVEQLVRWRMGSERGGLGSSNDANGRE